jgi:hypothetical protein
MITQRPAIKIRQIKRLSRCLSSLNKYLIFDNQNFTCKKIQKICKKIKQNDKKTCDIRTQT